MIQKIRKELKSLKNHEKAKVLQRYFKTGKGEYGEGDIFLGLTSEQIKNVAKKYPSLDLPELKKLLSGKIHEERVCALRILTIKYKKADEKEKKLIVDFYLKNSKGINNWDLVDLSCYPILGDHLLDKDKKNLYRLARSKNLWQRRIAIISTYAFIRQNKFDDTIKIAKVLLKDQHDLIQKAVGWMLREVGKRDKKILINFLKLHHLEMPRVMLRYSLERLSKEERKKYL